MIMMGQYHNAKQGAVRYNGNLKVLYKLKTVTCGCLGWGSQIPILTAYLESEGFFTASVKLSSNSVQPLLRYYNLQTHSKVGTENLYLGNPSHLMT